ncbi:piggyBac transposable element-derived protein 3-like [Aphis craccivora]|uniref:PiggyBac transposable element-derived protein 3-like n=1 Tax=Aphis craccivora TaxID=307492 RepID=A0A6G0YBP9_APHCR|nr:piggyBac transposable element-derived protein 3-like [Aphis craccivora]
MDLSFENGFSLSEALDILLNEDIEGDIFIEPPYPHVESDGDSADEDGSGGYVVDTG